MKVFYLATLIFIISLVSCKKNHSKPVSEDYLLERTLSFYLKDSLNGKNLVGKSGEKYNPDSIRILLDSKTGKTILDNNGQYYSGIVYLSANVTKEEDINLYYIDLPVFVYLNQSDTDTIKIKKEFNQQIRFYYNDKFIDSTPALNKNIPILTIKK